MDNQFDFRLNMVRHSMKYGVSDASEVFGRTRKTVRKWRDRYMSEGLTGLEDRSRRPHFSPNKTSQKDIDKIVKKKKKMKHIGAERLHHEFGIKQSARTIQKYCREAGLGRKRKSKREQQRDLRKWKEENFAALRSWGVDTKDCSDIPYYLERIVHAGFPRYLYQARDIRTNTLYSAYAYEQTNMNSAKFIARLFDHLVSLGIPLDEITIQTDNGTEYTRNGKDLTKKSMVEKTIDEAEAIHVRIPLGAKNYQSDVERANGLIEYELLEIERWKTKNELIGKTTAWEYYFNRLRPNSYQQNKTPYQRMKEAGIQSKTAEKACLWSIPILDDPKLKYVDFNLPQGGYHVCKFDVYFFEFPLNIDKSFHKLYSLYHVRYFRHPSSNRIGGSISHPHLISCRAFSRSSLSNSFRYRQK